MLYAMGLGSHGMGDMAEEWLRTMKSIVIKNGADSKMDKFTATTILDKYVKDKMKQIIDRNRIKADLLAKKPTRKIRNAIENDAFYVVEDICVDDLHHHGNFRWLAFKLSGKIWFSKRNLMIPSPRDIFGVDRILNSKSWQNKRMYLVFVKDVADCVGVYVCDGCKIADNELYKKAFPDSIMQNMQRGIISLQLLSMLTIPRQNKPDNNRYSIHRHICVHKRYSYDGESSSTNYQIVLTNGEMQVTFQFSDGGKLCLIEPTGSLCDSGEKAFSQVYINAFYYVGFVNDKPKYLFSAEHWKLSTEFNFIPNPQPKPAARQEYLQEIKPLIDRGIAREIYGNDTVSILNLAHSYYAITDYRKDVKETTRFVCVLCDHSTVKMFFRHPKELPLIMATIRKVRLQSRLYDELATLFYHTQETGPDDRIDLQMENDIKEFYPGDVFETLQSPSFSKNDWLNRWNQEV